MPALSKKADEATPSSWVILNMLMLSYLESELFSLFLSTPGHYEGYADKSRTTKNSGQSLTVLTGGSSWIREK